MNDNKGTLPDLAPRGTFGGIIVVWVAAVLAGVAIAVFAVPSARGGWLVVALGCSVALSFAVQLRSGRSQRFLFRVAAGVLGALLVLGLVGAGLGLASLYPGLH